MDKFSPTYKGLNIALSGTENATAEWTGDGGATQVASGPSVAAGKVYFEFSIDSLGSFSGSSNNFGLGTMARMTDWSALSGASGGVNIRITSSNVHEFLTFFGYTGSTRVAGDVIGFVVDYSTGDHWISINNSWVAANPSQSAVVTAGTDVYPTAFLIPGGIRPAITLRLRAEEFSYSIPSGCVAYDTSAMPIAFPVTVNIGSELKGLSVAAHGGIKKLLQIG